MRDGEKVSDVIRLSEAFGAVGSADHDASGVSHLDVEQAFAELHPATAARLLRHLRHGIDRDGGATASGSEHPEWHDALKRELQASKAEGYDVEATPEECPECGAPGTATRHVDGEAEWDCGACGHTWRVQ